MSLDNNDNKACSFCGRLQSEVSELIAAHTVYICCGCIDFCYDMMQKNVTASPFGGSIEDEGLKMKLLKPSEIKASLDEYIVGQDKAKKTLAVAIYNHYKRMQGLNATLNIEDDNDVVIEKSNILLIGPTGCGKTLLAKRIASELNLPFCIVDATTLTEAGYVGNDVDNILSMLLQDADYDLEKAQSGVVYIDEIDKISRKVDNHSRIRDISGEGVQEALLKMIEGSYVHFSPQDVVKDRRTSLPIRKINTSNILFIFGGAFSGLKDIISRRKNQTKIGFHSSKDENSITDNSLLKEIEVSDLIRYGMIPEFIARCPVIVTLDALDKQGLKKIFTDTKNSIVKQYKKLVKMDGFDLVFTDSAYDAIAEFALRDGNGARSLRRIAEDVLIDIMFEIPDKRGITSEIVIDEKVVNDKVGHRKNSNNIETSNKDDHSKHQVSLKLAV